MTLGNMQAERVLWLSVTCWLGEDGASMQAKLAPAPPSDSHSMAGLPDAISNEEAGQLFESYFAPVKLRRSGGGSFLRAGIR